MNPPTRIDTVFFDLDGTLTDPKEGITRCIQHALRQLGEPAPDGDALIWCIGPPLMDSFTHLVGADRADTAVHLYRERFADVGLFENSPYPGIHDTLATLVEAGLTLHVASSKPLVFVRRILDHYGLATYFEKVYGAELDGTRTDKSDLLAHALADVPVSAQQSVMVGDRKHDAVGAHDNLMAFVGALYGYGGRPELERAGASRLALTHQELPELIAGL